MQRSSPIPSRLSGWRLGFCLVVASSAFLCGQDGQSSGSQTSALRFEVASIRPTDPKNHQGSYWRTTPAGDIYVHSVPLLALIVSAYGLQDFQVLGYPNWVRSDSFDVEAKSGEEPAAKADQGGFNARVQTRLRTLLAERCQLVVRRSAKSQLAWVLTVDRRGLKMPSAERDPEPTNFHPSSFTAGAMTMPELSTALSRIMQSVVVDQTGLSGAYKIDLKWSRPSEALAKAAAAPGPDVPDMPGALREQLGLSLTRRDAMVDVLIVEGIQKPSSN